MIFKRVSQSSNDSNFSRGIFKVKLTMYFFSEFIISELPFINSISNAEYYSRGMEISSSWQRNGKPKLTICVHWFLSPLVFGGAFW